MSRNMMKVVFFMLLLSLVLAACGGETATPTAVSPAPTATVVSATASTATAATMAEPTATAATIAEPTVTTAAPTATSADTPAATATGAGAAATSRGDTLTVAVAGAPASLDPGDGQPNSEPFYTLAYDSLLRFDADGNYQPGLATAWKWIGSDFKTLELTLRPDVKFSDGSTFDAAAVKGWLELQKSKASSTAANIGLDSAEVTGPLTIQLKLANPNSLLPTFLTRNWISGDIPCPAAVADPSILATATCGAGPYMVDKAATVTGDTYTYVPNPNYWNPGAIHWNKIVLKVVATPQGGLDALRSGQVQIVLPADAGIIEAAEAAGKQETGVEFNVQGMLFLFRDGTNTPALKEPKVRQALNYAIDRDALSKVLAGGKGRPIAEQFLPGSDAYDPALETYYTYDVAKARQLLSEAGYADGFELTLLSAPFLSFDTIAQAVASYWEAVGVKVKIDSKPTAAEWLNSLLGGTYSVAVGGLGATSPMLVAWGCCYRPGAAWNPDKTSPTEIQALIDQLSSTSPAEMAPLAQQINKIMTEDAWFVPIIAVKLEFLYDPSVTGLKPTPTEPVINLTDVTPAQ